MKDRRFHKIVVIEPKIGRHRYVRSVADSARVLLREWPEGRRGTQYMAAQRAVLEAMKGKKYPSHARNALIKAANEAKILIDKNPVVKNGVIIVQSPDMDIDSPVS